MWILTLIVALSSGTLQVETISMKNKQECLSHAEVAVQMRGYDFEVVMVSCSRVKEI